MSDHEVAFVKFEINQENDTITENDTKAKNKLNWKDATDHQKLDYNNTLFIKLIMMEIPENVLHGTDLHCKNENHKFEMDNYVNSLMSNISDSGHQTIPVKVSKPNKNRKNDAKSIAGWKYL